MDLNGTWYNELGSTMKLTINGNNITGTYYTAVGDAKFIYNIVGLIDTGNKNNIAIGWTVVWQNQAENSQAVTSWSGEVQMIDNAETIVTTWLLTIETNTFDDWRSTIVGKDVFRKQPPSGTEIKANMNRGVRISHPDWKK
ncbi:MAG: avidin/streptavidin family protein [Bacteroidia bacterium]